MTRAYVNVPMLPLNISGFSFSRKFLIAAAVLCASVVLAGLFLYEVYAQPLPVGHNANVTGSVPAGTVYLSPQGVPAAVVTPTKNAPMQEVHIANSGLTLLRGARVVSISGNVIHLQLTLGGSDFTWAAVTKYNTDFLTSMGTKQTISDIQSGDIVSVTGNVTASGVEPTVDADYVREQ